MRNRRTGGLRRLRRWIRYFFEDLAGVAGDIVYNLRHRRHQHP